jgi:hypothetical protein
LERPANKREACEMAVLQFLRIFAGRAPYRHGNVGYATVRIVVHAIKKSRSLDIFGHIFKILRPGQVIGVAQNQAEQ